MSVKMATYINGNAALPEFPALSERRMAGSGTFGGNDLTDNWFHFSMTTPIMLDNKRLSLARAFIFYRMMYAQVTDVHLCSGQTKVAEFKVTQVPTVPVRGTNIRFADDTLRDQYAELETMFTPTQPIVIGSGLSVSIKVSFNSQALQNARPGPTITKRNLGKIEFYSVGVDWVE
jgi:hypothetical protein